MFMDDSISVENNIEMLKVEEMKTVGGRCRQVFQIIFI